MSDLIERLMKAQEPNRELDARLECAGMGYAFIQLSGSDMLFNVPGVGWAVKRGMEDVPKYTASIDAALKLVPDGWEWLVSNRGMAPHTGRAYLNNREMISVGGGLTPNPRYMGAENTAATPAIALCISALKARDLKGAPS